MPLFDPRAASAAANDDAEFKLAARFWTATLRLDVGDQPYLLKLRDGLIVSFHTVTPPEAAQHDLHIAAPASDWRELLQPVPRPFYQDLMPHACATTSPSKVISSASIPTIAPSTASSN